MATSKTSQNEQTTSVFKSVPLRYMASPSIHADFLELLKLGRECLTGAKGHWPDFLKLLKLAREWLTETKGHWSNFLELLKLDREWLTGA